MLLLYGEALIFGDEMSDYYVVEVTKENLSKHKDVICFINPKHPSYPSKIEWIKQQMNNGLVIKLLYKEGVKKAVGYIEYIPGKYNWRSVNADNYMFIHCIFINGKKHQGKGLGKRLLEECEKDTIEKGFNGIAVLTSEDSFMATKQLFLKTGYEIVSNAKPKYTLLIKKFSDMPNPSINDNSDKLKAIKGLHLFYSKQCPWVARFALEVGEVIKDWNIELDIHEITNPIDAQNSFSPYSVFTLVNNGKILSEHYISFTRLRNILKKEKLI